MSLQIAAQHLASKGRNGDSTLVHMTPGEVNSLQTIAKAHGGTLTTNPDTGLPEAGFLSAILPIVAGAALGPAGAGLFSSALTAGLGVGAATGLMSGSLRKGLMAGLGAYGGAGLMGSITGAGNAALQAANTTPGAMGVAGSAPTSGIANIMQGGAAAPAVAPVEGFVPTAANYGPGGAMLNTAPVYPGTSGALGSGTSAIGAPANAPFIATNTVAPATAPAANLAPVVDKSVYPVANSFQEGVKAIAKSPSEFLTKQNLYYGAAAAAPLMFQEPKRREGYTGSGPNPYQYEYSANPTGVTPSGMSSREEKYFDPRYRRMADGGLTSDPYYNMTGESADAYRYLMGGSAAPAYAAPRTATSTVGLPTGNEGTSYVYDPVTQAYREVATAAAPAAGLSALVPYTESGGMGSDPGDPDAPGPTGVTIGGMPDLGALTAPVASIMGMVNLGQGFIANAIQGKNPNPESVPVVDAVVTPVTSLVADDVAAMQAAAQGMTPSQVAADDAAAMAAAAQGMSGGETPGQTAANDAAAMAAAAQGMSGSTNGGIGPGGDTTGNNDSGSGDAAAAAAAAAGMGGGNSDSSGGGGGGGGGGCFLTTAAVEHMGQDDDGEVLSTLRHFRDTYMRKNKEKSKDVAWYYKNAPKIVAALDEMPNADRMYRNMYRKYIEPAYKAIKEGKNERAYEIYKDGIDYAKRVSGIEAKELSPRYGRNGMAVGGLTALASGGVSDLGSYSDGGRLLRGPGDGVSDSIPATIANKRPARLADGEFVVPARIVSELGNGSTEAGARKLYAMMNRIQSARGKTVGKGKVAVNSRADKHLPA